MGATARTRRALLANFFATGAAATAATALPRLLRPASAAADQSDAQLGQRLLAVELLGIAAYTQVMASGYLSPRARALARKLLRQEHEHVQVLRRLLGPSSAAVSAPASPAAIDDALSTLHVDRSVSDLHDERDALDLLLAVEQVSEGAYYSAISKLQVPATTELAARLLGVEAQHQAVLGELRDPRDLGTAVPYAFVEGIF